MTPPFTSLRGRLSSPSFQASQFVLFAYLFALAALCVGLYYRGLQMVGGLAAFMAAVALVVAGPLPCFLLYFCTTFAAELALPGIPVSLNRILAVLFVVSFVVSLPRRPFRVRLSPLLVFFTASNVYAVVAANVVRESTFIPGIQATAYLACFLIIASSFRTRRDLTTLLGGVLLITAAVSLVGPAEFVLKRDLFSFSGQHQIEESTRVNGVSKDAIQYAYIAVWALPITLFFHVNGRRLVTRLGALVLAAYLLVDILITFNRQSIPIMAGMFAAGIVMLRYRHKAALVAFVLVVMVLAAPFVAPKIAERFASAGSLVQDLSYTIRHDKLVVGREILAKHPFVGLGLDQFAAKWADYRGQGMYYIQFDHTHEWTVDLGYLQIVAETGLIGAVLFLGVAASAAMHLLGLWRRTRLWEDPFHQNVTAVVAMMFVQLMLSLILQDTYYSPRTYFLFGILLALDASVRSEEMEGTPPAPALVPAGSP